MWKQGSGWGCKDLKGDPWVCYLSLERWYGMESPGELHLAPFYSGCGREWGQNSQGRGYCSRATWDQHFSNFDGNWTVDEKDQCDKIGNWLVIEEEGKSCFEYFPVNLRSRPCFFLYVFILLLLFIWRIFLKTPMYHISRSGWDLHLWILKL